MDDDRSVYTMFDIDGCGDDSDREDSCDSYIDSDVSCVDDYPVQPQVIYNRDVGVSDNEKCDNDSCDGDSSDDEHGARLGGYPNNVQNTYNRNSANSVYTLFDHDEDEDEDAIWSDHDTRHASNTNSRDNARPPRGSDNQDADTKASSSKDKTRRSAGIWDHVQLPLPNDQSLYPMPAPTQQAQVAQEAPNMTDDSVRIIVNNILSLVAEDKIESIPLNAERFVEIRPGTKERYPGMTKTVFDILNNQRISLLQRHRVFESLNWKFLCPRCEVFKNAPEFPVDLHLFLKSPVPRSAARCTACVMLP